MYKVILAAVVAFGVFGAPAIVHAEPTSTQQTHVVKKKKVVKKKQKKTVSRAAVKVADDKNPFLRDCGVLGCSSGTTEESTAEYWRKENERQARVLANVVPQKKHTREEQRREVVKSCVWFVCTETVKDVVVEAKKWEGKHAKKNKQELKALFAATGQGPVDPVNIPWCAAFANAILRRTDIEGTDSLMARSFLTWGAKTVDPKEGDVVVLKRGKSQWAGHVGFFVGYEWMDGVKYVKVLGGNQNKEVNVAYFPASQVLGYRTVA